MDYQDRFDIITRGEREAGGPESEKGDVMRKADIGMMWGREPRSVGSLQKLDKARN